MKIRRKQPMSPKVQLKILEKKHPQNLIDIVLSAFEQEIIEWAIFKKSHISLAPQSLNLGRCVRARGEWFT